MPSKGCIEFWAKLSNFIGSNFILNTIHFIEVWYEIENAYSINIAANDGLGGAGLCGQAGYCGDYATGRWTTGYTYDQVLNGGDVSEWHHYALVWNADGITSGTNLQLYLDGSLYSCGFFRNPTNFPSSLTTVNMKIILNDNNFGSVMIDNLKIWNYAKTNFDYRFTE